MRSEKPTPVNQQPDEPALHLRPSAQAMAQVGGHRPGRSWALPPIRKCRKELAPPQGCFVLVQIRVLAPQETGNLVGAFRRVIAGGHGGPLLADRPDQALQVTEGFGRAEPSVLDGVTEPLPIVAHLGNSGLQPLHSGRRPLVESGSCRAM